MSTHAHATVVRGAAGEKLFGVMAEFDNEHTIVQAAKRMYALGYRKMDGFSPIPVHGLDVAIGRKRSKLPILILAAGLTGAATGLGMQVWTSAFAYPMNIAGRPLISWPMFVPITFELTILFASLTAVFGMLGINGLPQPYHPTFNVPAFVKASDNSFFLIVETTDPAFDLAKVKADFEPTGCRAIHEVPE